MKIEVHSADDDEAGSARMRHLALQHGLVQIECEICRGRAPTGCRRCKGAGVVFGLPPGGSTPCDPDCYITTLSDDKRAGLKKAEIDPRVWKRRVVLPKEKSDG